MPTLCDDCWKMPFASNLVVMPFACFGDLTQRRVILKGASYEMLVLYPEIRTDCRGLGCGRSGLRSGTGLKLRV